MKQSVDASKTVLHRGAALCCGLRPRQNIMGQALSVAAAIALPLGAGIGMSVGMQKQVKGWYKHLKKPSWQPPNWLFGPVWTALYAMMGVASWLVWQNGGGAVPLSLYAVQLALNLAWTPLFFKEHQLTYALADITVLLGVLTATVVEFNKVSPQATYLLLPYLGWSTFAAVLTLDIWKRNPEERRVPKAWKRAADKSEEQLRSANGDEASATS